MAITSRPVFPQYLRLKVVFTVGDQTITLDQRFIRHLKTTLTTLSGSAKAELDLYVPPTPTPSLDGLGVVKPDWPWRLRAMDKLRVDAAVVPSWTLDPVNWQTIWTGYLDDIPTTDNVQTGTHIPLSASNVFKLFEVSTETDAFYAQNMFQSINVPVSTFVARAIEAVGLPPATLKMQGDPADLSTGLIPITNINNDAITANPHYRNWIDVISSACTMVGREMFGDEVGNIIYRLSDFMNQAKATVPQERIVDVNLTVDRDIGLVNIVSVRYGYQENKFHEKSSGPPPNFPISQYQRRQLILAIPTLTRDEDAQWYAQWVLSWASRNQRPGIVILAFWPEVRVGTVYRVPYSGRSDPYYVSSVVHQYDAGSAPFTVLGLTYGAPIEGNWPAPPDPPKDFGIPYQPAYPGFTKSVNGTYSTGASFGSNWFLSYYNTVGLAKYHDDHGDYVQTSSGAKLYRNDWQVKDGGVFQPYDPVRPAAFDPNYKVPELGNVTLNYGDRIYLPDNRIVELQDHIGTDATFPLTRGGQLGREIDVFYWDKPSAISGTMQTVTFLRIASVSGYDFSAPSQADMPIIADAGSDIIGPYTGGGGDPIMAAQAYAAAQGLFGVLTNGYGGDDNPNGKNTTFRLARNPSEKVQGYNLDNPPPGMAYNGSLAEFCYLANPIYQYFRFTGAYGRWSGLVQCTIFVRFVLARNGYAQGNFGNGKDAINLVHLFGFQDVTGDSPEPGDIISFGAISNQNDANGHVGMVYQVLAPDSTGENGKLYVANSNTDHPVDIWPLVKRGQSFYVVSVPGFGPWLNLIRPRRAG